MAPKYKPSEMAQRLIGLTKQLDEEQMKAGRYVMFAAKTEALTRLRSGGLGRALWKKSQKSQKQLARQIYVSKLVRSGGVLRGHIEAYGSAAKIDVGEKTKQHIIRSRKGKVLAFSVGGAAIFSTIVRHPGSRVPARPFMRDVRAMVLRDMPKALDAAHQRVINSVIG